MSRAISAAAAGSRARPVLLLSVVGAAAGLLAGLTHVWLGMPVDQGLYLSGLPLPLSAARDVAAVLHGEGPALAVGTATLLVIRGGLTAFVASVAAPGSRLVVLLTLTFASYVPGLGALLLALTDRAGLAGAVLSGTAGLWMAATALAMGRRPLPSLGLGVVGAVALAGMTPVGEGAGFADALTGAVLGGAEGAIGLLLACWFMPARRQR